MDIVFKHPLPPTSLLGDRMAWLVEQCRAKRVLHIGCVDAGLLEERFVDDRHLHALILRVAERAIGVDVDGAGLARLESMGIRDLVRADVSQQADEVIRFVRDTSGTCDVIVCGEVLEHIPNVGRFLAGVREVADAFESTILLSVPNALSLRGVVDVMFGNENVHPDHKYYFSWKTIDTLLMQSGLSLERVLYYSNESRSESTARRLLKSCMNRVVLQRRPHLAEGLIGVARPVH
jgi:predicted TPR repeat methyltransferase